MIKQTGLLFTVAIMTTTGGNVIADNNPFVEQNGKLIVEVESATVSGDWSIQSEIAGHTGAAYLVWQGQNNYAKSQAPRGNPIQYHIEITTPGNYQLQWRSRNTIGLDATEHNDSWVRFPSGKNIDGQHALNGWTKAYMGQVAQWTWDVYTVDSNNQPIRQYFDAGVHLIEIAGRSFGHGLDRFALYRYEQEQFSASSFDVLPQSPRVSELQQPAHALTGNSCEGSTLSLSASDVRSSDAQTAFESDADLLTIGNSSDYAFIKFDVPVGVSTSNSLLKLTSTRANSLQTSVYLGGHSNWSVSTPAENLPYAATLLGVLEESSDGINTLLMGTPILPGQPLSLVLNTEQALPQTVFSVGTPAEPRLEIQVPTDFCTIYNLKKTGIYVSDGGVDDSTDNENITNPDGPDKSAPDDNTEIDDSNNATITNNTDGSNQSGSDIADVEDQEAPVDVVAQDIGQLFEPAQTRKRLGSMSIWALLSFASITLLCRFGHGRMGRIWRAR